jgi:spore coat protein U-like protein
MSLMFAGRALPLALVLFSGPVVACSVSATSLNFGVINPLTDGATVSTTTVSVDCPETAGYTLSVSAGNGGYDQRWLVDGGGHRLYYNLYTDQSYNQVVGDGSGVSVTVAGSSGTETLHGRLPAQRTAVPGVYGDQLVVTVSF